MSLLKPYVACIQSSSIGHGFKLIHELEMSRTFKLICDKCKTNHIQHQPPNSKELKNGCECIFTTMCIFTYLYIIIFNRFNQIFFHFLVLLYPLKLEVK